MRKLLTVLCLLTGTMLTATPAFANSPYSGPNICSKDMRGQPTVMCMNSRGEHATTGNHVQIWPHDTTGNVGNHFEAYSLGIVNDTEPFDNHAIDRAYAGEHVVEFHYERPTGGDSGLCVSTQDATLHNGGTNDEYWFPLVLETCSETWGHDPHETHFVWDKEGSSGIRIEAVGLTNATNSVQHVSCVYYDPQTTCEAGNGMIAEAVVTAPHWEHWNEATSKERAVNVWPAWKDTGRNGHIG